MKEKRKEREWLRNNCERKKIEKQKKEQMREQEK